LHYTDSEVPEYVSLKRDHGHEWVKVVFFHPVCYAARVQVSIFLRDKVQHSNTGRFVLPISGCLPVDVELPGKIRSAVLSRCIVKMNTLALKLQ